MKNIKDLIFQECINQMSEINHNIKTIKYKRDPMFDSFDAEFEKDIKETQEFISNVSGAIRCTKK